MGVSLLSNMGSCHKPCLGCAFGWGLLAVVLVAVALGTDFWYVVDQHQILQVSSNTVSQYTAVAYGVVDYCKYTGTKDWTINVGDSGWTCSKWEDADSSDCKKAAANGLAWGIMGL